MIEIDADTRIRGFLKTLIERVETSEERMENYTSYGKTDNGPGVLTIHFTVDDVSNLIRIYMDDGPDDPPEPIEWAVNMTKVVVSTPSASTKHCLADNADTEACLARLRAMVSWGWL